MTMFRICAAACLPILAVAVEVGAGWFSASDHRPASGATTCAIISTESSIRIIFEKDRQGRLVKLMLVPEHDPRQMATLNVGGQVRKSLTGGTFSLEDADGAILDMLVADRLWLEWYPWPSGLQEETESLRDFPLSYLACRRIMGLPESDSLIRIIEDRDEGLRFLRDHGLAAEIVTSPYVAYRIELPEGGVQSIALQVELGEARHDLVRQALEMVVSEHGSTLAPAPETP